MDHADIRLKLATSDVRTARRNGSLLIGQTARGLVEVTRTETGARLTVCSQIVNGTYINSEILAEGSQAAIARALAPLYVIVTEEAS